MKKRILALLLAVGLLALASCTDNTDTPSAAASSTSSTSNTPTDSYAKPANVSHDGTSSSDLGGSVIDITLPLAEEQNSLDSYNVEAFFAGDRHIVVFSTYFVETAPNFYVERAYVSVVTSTDGSYTEQCDIQTRGYNGDFPTCAAYDNGFVLAYSNRICHYDFTFNETSAHTGKDITLFAVAKDGSALYAEDGLLYHLDAEGNIADLSIEATDIKFAAIAQDGSIAAVTDGTKGTVIKLGGVSENYSVELSTIQSSFINVVCANDSAYFISKLEGGIGTINAVRLTSSAEMSELTLAEDFANPYQRGSIFSANGRIYTVTAQTARQFDYGDAVICVRDESLGATAISTLPGGYSFYNRYDLAPSGQLLVTENVIDGTDIKNYIHIIEVTNA